MEKTKYFIMVGNCYVKNITFPEYRLILTKESNERKEYPTLDTVKFDNREIEGKIFKEVTTIKVTEVSEAIKVTEVS